MGFIYLFICCCCCCFYSKCIYIYIYIYIYREREREREREKVSVPQKLLCLFVRLQARSKTNSKIVFKLSIVSSLAALLLVLALCSRFLCCVKWSNTRHKAAVHKSVPLHRVSSHSPLTTATTKHPFCVSGWLDGFWLTECPKQICLPVHNVAFHSLESVYVLRSLSLRFVSFHTVHIY